MTRLTAPLLAAALVIAAIDLAAAAETVFVNSVDLVDRSADASGKLARLIVTRADGRSFVLDADSSCGTVEPGEELLLEADGPAPAPGTTLRRRGSGTACAVESVEVVRIVRVAPGGSHVAGEASRPGKRLERALAEALAIVGYGPGAEEGDDALARALARYRADRWHDVRGKSVRFSFWALALEVLVERPGDREALRIASLLFDAGE